MLLAQRPTAFDDPAWTFELKYDGYRLMAQTTPTGAALKTRNGANATTWFPEVAKGLYELALPDCVFDGEVCVLDQYGRTDFNQLHARARARRHKPGTAAVAYAIFDVLVFRGRNVCALPLRERQVLLEEVFERPGSSLLRVTGFQGEGNWLFEQACGLELEGIVGKRLDSPYLPGERSPSWVKVKRKGATPAQRFDRAAMRDPLA